jgi:hypothetical protein
MDVEITRFVGGRWDGTELWKGLPAEPVQQHAKLIVETGLADRVEVRDMADRLVFQWPRTLRKG